MEQSLFPSGIFVQEDLLRLCDALDQFATAIINTFPHGTDQAFHEIWGWPAPAVNRQEFSWMVKSIADDLRAADPQSYPESKRAWIQQLAQRIAMMQSQTLPNTYGGNLQGFTAMFEGVRVIREQLLPAIGWVSVPNGTALPAQLSRRANAARQRIVDIEATIPGLSDKVSAIASAHQVAENLEVDLQSLREAREAVERTTQQMGGHASRTAECAASTAQILESTQQKASAAWNEVQAKSETALSELQRDVQAVLEKIRKKEEVAEKLIAKCEEAYQIATTKGLAGAFDQKAASLALSMRLWVVGLAAALIAGSAFGAYRLTSVAAELKADNPNWPAISVQLILAAMGVAAPLWFSWLATKQIGQRFRLSEDYAFKASVAKAYEGYRKEAATLDPEFQSTLFRSALTRLDEAPLRLVETEQHGSPWLELLNSGPVKDAVKAAPELPSKFLGMVNEALQQANSAKAEATKLVDAAKSVVGAATPKDG